MTQLVRRHNEETALFWWEVRDCDDVPPLLRELANGTKRVACTPDEARAAIAWAREKVAEWAANPTTWWPEENPPIRVLS